MKRDQEKVKIKFGINKMAEPISRNINFLFALPPQTFTYPIPDDVLSYFPYLQQMSTYVGSTGPYVDVSQSGVFTTRELVNALVRLAYAIEENEADEYLRHFPADELAKLYEFSQRLGAVDLLDAIEHEIKDRQQLRFRQSRPSISIASRAAIPGSIAETTVNLVNEFNTAKNKGEFLRSLSMSQLQDLANIAQGSSAERDITMELARRNFGFNRRSERGLSRSLGRMDLADLF